MYLVKAMAFSVSRMDVRAGKKKFNKQNFDRGTGYTAIYQMNSHITKLIKKIPLLICFSFISDIVSLSQESWKCRHPALHGALSLPPS